MKKIPFRMCVGCKERLPQKELVRLSCQDGVLLSYIGHGRSFYLCQVCIKKGERAIKKPLSRICKKEVKINNLEKILNG